MYKALLKDVGRPRAPGWSRRHGPNRLQRVLYVSQYRSARARNVYQQRICVWRPSGPIDVEGKPATQVYDIIYVHVPAMIEPGKSFHSFEANPPGVVSEGDFIISTDQVHTDAAVVLAPFDVFVCTLGPEAGGFWSVRGEPQSRPGAGLKNASSAVTQCTRIDTPPRGVPRWTITP